MIFSRLASFALLFFVLGNFPPCAWCQNSPINRSFPATEINEIRTSIELAIKEQKIPGAVFRMEQEGLSFQQAFGVRSIEPAREVMTVDSIFDVASLTKVVATAPSIMILAEQGKLRLDENIGIWFQEFASRNITVR